MSAQHNELMEFSWAGRLLWKRLTACVAFGQTIEFKGFCVVADGIEKGSILEVAVVDQQILSDADAFNADVLGGLRDLQDFDNIWGKAEDLAWMISVNTNEFIRTTIIMQLQCIIMKPFGQIRCTLGGHLDGLDEGLGETIVLEVPDLVGHVEYLLFIFFQKVPQYYYN